MRLDKTAIEEASQRAIDLVKDIPDEFRHATYSVVLATLLGEIGTSPARVGEFRSTAQRERPREFKDRDEMMMWIDGATLDFSGYDSLIDDGTWVDRAMVVLEVVERETGISELTPPELAKIMKDKLRVPSVYATNISRDLSRNRMFTKTPEGRANKYALTRNAMAYLEENREG